jgi:endonuclease G
MAQDLMARFKEDKKFRSNVYFTFFLIAIFFGVFIHSCTYNNDTVSNPQDEYKTPKINSIHVALGVPEDGTPSDDWWLETRAQYVLSYNKDLNVANWVAWNLDANWYGEVERFGGNFKEDPMLPNGYYRVKHSDYTNSGYSRGHMVRSEERTATTDDNISTFYMTNILPQYQDLNGGPWLDLEYYCEDLCKKQNKELFVIAGGTFKSGNKINSLVAIPDSCFKIIVILDRDKGLRNVDKNTQVIAVMMPNITGIIKKNWQEYTTTVDAIELSTKYDFLNSLPKGIQEVIESKRVSSFGINKKVAA